MASDRDGFSPLVVRTLMIRAGGLCSNPSCGQATIGPAGTLPDKTKVNGIGSHIRAAAPGGPRYDPDQSLEERSGIENGIWLCPSCASLIDKNDGVDHPHSLLHLWKREAEDRASDALESGNSPREAIWIGQFAGLNYLNVPRLAILAAGQGIDLDISYLTGSSWLHELSIGLVSVLVQMENVLGNLILRAIPIEKIASVSEDYTGSTVSFDTNFYTKNGVDILGSGPPPNISADWKKAPHIHRKIGGMKFVIVYDPRWITTATAFVSFRSGNQRMNGYGIVKEIDRSNEMVFVSPLVIGIPKPDFDFLD